MLHRNGVLDYAIIPPDMENEALCLQGENSFRQQAFMVADNPTDDLAKKISNSWRITEGQIILVATFLHRQMVLLPLQWEGSIVKLLAEFVSLTSVIYDIPPMGAGAATSEILRRCQHLLNKELKHHRREFSTPYCGFYHTHMAGFNQIVMDAMALPAGVDMKHLAKEGLLPAAWEYQLQFSVDKKQFVQLQWPFRLGQLRVVDENNLFYSFQMKEITRLNLEATAPHVNLSRDGLFYYKDYEVPARAVIKLIQHQFGGRRRGKPSHNLHRTLPEPENDYEHPVSEHQVSL